MKKLVVVLPTFNEKGNISDVIENILVQQKKLINWEMVILVVDSRSQDGTADEVKKLQRVHPNLMLLETPKEGLGRAYTRAFSYLDEKVHPYLVIQMDADLSHDPKEIPALIKKIEKGADFVIGTRYSKGGSIPTDWGLHRKIFSILGNQVIKFGFMKPKITEWTNGYRAIKFWLVKKAFDHIKNYSGYVYQIAFLDFALKNNAVLDEIPIHFKERKSGVSKINAVQYIANILLYVFAHSSFIKFVIVGFLGFFVDFGISYLLIEKMYRPIWTATLISTEIAIACNFLLNNFWSFSHKKIDGGFLSFIFSFLKFNLVSSGSVAIQTLGLQLLVSVFGKDLWYLYKVVIITFVIIPYSYILYNKVVWKSK